jgi:hypothetical protein
LTYVGALYKGNVYVADAIARTTPRSGSICNNHPDLGQFQLFLPDGDSAAPNLKGVTIKPQTATVLAGRFATGPSTGRLVTAILPSPRCPISTGEFGGTVMFA